MLEFDDHYQPEFKTDTRPLLPIQVAKSGCFFTLLGYAILIALIILAASYFRRHV